MPQMQQQFDPFQAMNPSGLQKTIDPNRRFKQPGVVPDADPSKFGFAQPEEYQKPQVKFENSAPPGYDINISNDEQPAPNTMRVASLQGYTPQTYDYSIDPHIKQMSDAFDQVKALNDRENQIEHDYKPSKVRRVLAAAAGIGTGILTMNPLAGMGVNKSITDAPKHDQIGQLEKQKAGALQQGKLAEDITGMGATLKQREAEYGAAQAGQQNANTNARKQQYDEENPEVTPEKITSGDAESIVTVPKRRGPASGGVKQVVQGKPNFVAGRKEIMTDSSGKAASVDKGTGEKTPIEGDYNPSGASDMTRYEQAYKKDHPEDTQLKGFRDWLARQPNYSLQAGEASRAAASTATSESEQAATAISGRIKSTDNDAAYAEGIAMLDKMVAKDKTISEHADKIRAALRAKYPHQAKTGGTYTPGSISGAKKPGGGL